MGYFVFAVTVKGNLMVDPHDRPRRRVAPAAPRSGGFSIDGRWLLGALLLLTIAVAAIAGIVVAAASGQHTVAIAIAVVAGAFFTRVAC